VLAWPPRKPHRMVMLANIRNRLRHGSMWLVAALCLGIIPQQSLAHPHVWVKVDATVLVEAGMFTGLRYVWHFDQAYLQSLLELFDTDKDGVLSETELNAWLDLSVKTLRDQKLFTVARIGKQRLVFGPPREASFKKNEAGIDLAFLAPLTKPAAISGQELQIDIYDPTFFSGFDYSIDHPAVVRATPELKCQATVALNPSGEQQKVIDAFMKVFGRADAKVPPAKTLTVVCHD
jgi:ABC-type uncharacterized transport system substrate-binding protein